MSLRDHGINRRQIRQGGGRGTGADHVEEMFGSTELYIYQTPNSRRRGVETLQTFLEAQGCQIEFNLDPPPELARLQTIRITHKETQEIPIPVLKRAHSWAHQRNYLHSFFRPMYR